MKDSRRKCDTLAVVLDMMQNAPLPKTNVTEAYYSRQLWLYNLGFVIHSYNMSRRNVFLFTWLESEGGKGSNEVPSALAVFLKKCTQHGRKRGYKTLHFFCDSCFRQNKNAAVMTLLFQYANSSKCPFKEISHISHTGSLLHSCRSCIWPDK